MKSYNIPEAIIFLAEEYGEANMPTSEETLRRAIRTKKLIAQEDGVPGRKGYSILESDLRAYAENRLRRARARSAKSAVISAAPTKTTMTDARDERDELIPFPELFAQYIEKKITPESYYQRLYTERTKWERTMHEKQALLAQLNARAVMLQNEIDSCQSSIDAYADGISKFQP